MGSHKISLILYIFSVVQVRFCEISLSNEAPLKPVLSVKLLKSNLISGEPIIVSIRAENDSQEPVANSFRNNDYFGRKADFAFSIQNREGIRICEINIPTNSVFDPVILLKRRLLRAREFFQCEKIFLPWMNLQGKKPFSLGDEPPDNISMLPPGSYKLTVRLRWAPPRMESFHIFSQPVEFNIREPVGVDARSVKLLESGQIVGFFEGYLGDKPEPISVLLKDYPESTYAKYARLRLVLDRGHLADGAGRIETGKNEMEDLIADGLNLVQTDIDMPLNDDVLLACARMNIGLGNEEESIRILTRLVKEFPNSNSAEAAQKKLTSYSLTPEQMRQILAADTLTRQKRSSLWIGIVFGTAAIGGIFVVGYFSLFKKKQTGNTE